MNPEWIAIAIASCGAPGETVPTDSWQLAWHETNCRLALVSAQRNGQIPATSAITMIEELARAPWLDPARAVERIHRLSDAPSEAPLFVARIDADALSLTVAGAGPLTASLCRDDACQTLLDAQGVAGGSLGAVRQLELAIGADWLLIVRTGEVSNGPTPDQVLAIQREMRVGAAALLRAIGSPAPGCSLLIAGPR